MGEPEEILSIAKGLQSSIEMVNSLKEQNQELIAALERIVSAKNWIGRDYKLFAQEVLLRMKEKHDG